MLARFLGKTSMGFIHGLTYDVYTKINDVAKYYNGVKYMPSCCICLYDKNSSAWCPYNSVEALLMNWEIIDIQMDKK